jgi:hypothetical protein
MIYLSSNGAHCHNLPKYTNFVPACELPHGPGWLPGSIIGDTDRLSFTITSNHKAEAIRSKLLLQVFY